MGCAKFKKKCDLCNNYLVEADKFGSAASGRFYKIKQRVGCTSKYVVYLVNCKECYVQYVGFTNIYIYQ